jgi:hypothetical protein
VLIDPVAEAPRGRVVGVQVFGLDLREVAREKLHDVHPVVPPVPIARVIRKKKRFASGKVSGDGEENYSTCTRKASEPGHGGVVVLDVFEDVIAEDEIVGVLRQTVPRQILVGERHVAAGEVASVVRAGQGLYDETQDLFRSDVKDAR